MFASGAYKKVANHVKPVNSSERYGKMPEGPTSWKIDGMKMGKYLEDPDVRYAKWLIPELRRMPRVPGLLQIDVRSCE